MPEMTTNLRDRIHPLYSPPFWATIPSPNADNIPPRMETTLPLSSEEQFKSQLERLNEMGFHDQEENLQALRESDGDIDGAVAYLIDEQSDE
jgi:hypothetical protein